MRQLDPMSRVCILTDNTAQFTRTDFPGREHVYLAPFDLETVEAQGKDPIRNVFSGQRLVPPSDQVFLQQYQDLAARYDSILVLTISALLSPALSNALSARARFHNPARVEVVDSRTTSIGLGWLVAEAATAICAGESLGTLVKRVHAASGRIFFLFFVPEMDALAINGHLSHAQALVADILGILPIFLLEEGRLAPLEKARSQRAVLEYFVEFLDEFETPADVALVHGRKVPAGRMQPIRQHIQEIHPQALLSEQVLTPALEALLGAQSFGMAILQKG